MRLSVSILNSKDKINMIKTLNNTKISYIHIDVMDGLFVSQKSLPSDEIIKISPFSSKPLDIHLMVENPMYYIERIKELPNIDNITIHLEINKDIKNILNKIKEYDFKRSLAIKPNTDINLLIPYLDTIDRILIMTVEPGLGGQPFLENSPNRIKEIKKLIKDKNIELEVDGGINNQTINKVKDIDISVVGSYITTSDNPVQRINNLLV
mgnify:FL=1